MADRDGEGKFQPGHSIRRPEGPGRTRLALWRRAASRAVTGDHVRQVMRKLTDEAIAGKRWAIIEFCRLFLGQNWLQPAIGTSEQGQADKIPSVAVVFASIQAAPQTPLPPGIVAEDLKALPVLPQLAQTSDLAQGGSDENEIDTGEENADDREAR